MLYISGSIICLIVLLAVVFTQHSERNKVRKNYITIRYRKNGNSRMDYIIQSFIQDYGFSEDFFQDEFADNALEDAIGEYRRTHPVDGRQTIPDGINVLEYR